MNPQCWTPPRSPSAGPLWKLIYHHLVRSRLFLSLPTLNFTTFVWLVGRFASAPLPACEASAACQGLRFVSLPAAVGHLLLSSPCSLPYSGSSASACCVGTHFSFSEPLQLPHCPCRSRSFFCAAFGFYFNSFSLHSLHLRSSSHILVSSFSAKLELFNSTGHAIALFSLTHLG